jgi:DNA repair photolyase
VSDSSQFKLFEVFTEAPPARIGPAVVTGRPKSKVLVPGRGSTACYDYTLNPYIGCSFGCSYCFAASFVPDEEKKASWGTWVHVKQDALHELSRADLKGKSIFMSSSTDPYQPLEMQTGLTRKIVEFMSEPYRQPRLTVQTRSPFCARDIDLFKRYDRLRINMSITTDNEEMRKLFEPKCASIDRRFEALEQACAAGVKVSVGVCPMLPIADPAGFAKRIAALKPVAVGIGRFHISDRPFTSTTRPEALKLANDLGWNESEMKKVEAELRRQLSHYVDSSKSYGPA